MAEPKTIYCPWCRRRVAHYDGRTTIDINANCKKCKKRIVYHVSTGEIKIKPIPPRSCSSGLTFL